MGEPTLAPASPLRPYLPGWRAGDSVKEDHDDSPAASAPAGAAAPLVRAKPSLTPGFDAAAPDYTVRCTAGQPVKLSFDAPSGTSVSVDGGPYRGGTFQVPVKLAPGRATTLRVRTSSETRNYHVRCLPADFPRFTAKRYRKPQAAFYVLTPNHNSFDPGYTTVVDSRGVPVWWMRSSTSTFDGHLLPNGHLAWNHWVGNSPESGPFEEHALDGRLVRTWDTVGVGHATNQHDLRILPNGNALIISYPARDHVDLSRWDGPKDATVLDGEIQEVDPLGNLVWSWRTNERLKLAETGHWLHTVLFDERPIHLKDGRSAYDVVHMNSVEPVGKNRLIFSARYEDAVYEIDKTTHDVVWKLGGRKTKQSLRLLGDSLPANEEFGGQHDARTTDGGKTVTLYENGTLRGRAPRAMAFRIDLAKGTARLVDEVRFGPAKDSVCCGSARKLPGGHWVVAWGHTPWVTEQTSGGGRVFTLEFDDPAEMSYRAEPVLPGRLARSALRRGMDAMAP
jgi:uncharacterized protein YndB with AHSA1/START domain